MPLRVRGHNAGGDDPVTELAVNLVAGQAAQLTLSPNGRIDAVVGANAGALRVRVSDAGGNPVAGVPVRLARPDAVNVSPNLVSQVSDAEGLVTWQLARIAEPGEHRLAVSATVPAGAVGEEPVELAGAVFVETGRGQAQALELRDLDGDVVPADEGEQAWVLRGAVGEDLPGVYTLARVNGRGGVLTGAGGLALQLISQPTQGCAALDNLASAQFSEAGLLRLGDGLELRLGTAARRCRYRLSVGGVFHDLLVVQEAGAPVGGSFEVNAGTLEAPAWEAAPQRLEPRPGYEQAPGVLPLSQVHHLRLRNPQDAFGNAIAAGTVLQPAARPHGRTPSAGLACSRRHGAWFQSQAARRSAKTPSSGLARPGLAAAARAALCGAAAGPAGAADLVDRRGPQTYRSNGGEANITPADEARGATKTAPSEHRPLRRPRPALCEQAGVPKLPRRAALRQPAPVPAGGGLDPSSGGQGHLSRRTARGL